MSSEAHTKLVGLGAKWLKRNGFSVIGTELVCADSREQPDAIGFRSTCCAIIEVKTSRADFLADARKPERSQGGLGLYRFYLCPEGLISPDDLPAGWGLLYASGRSIKDIIRPPGNLWLAKIEPSKADQSLHAWEQSWRSFQHESDPIAERSALFSIARRLSQQS